MGWLDTMLGRTPPDTAPPLELVAEQAAAPAPLPVDEVALSRSARHVARYHRAIEQAEGHVAMGEKQPERLAQLRAEMAHWQRLAAIEEGRP